MADGFETVGWIFKMKDAATASVAKIVKKLEENIYDVATGVSSVSEKFYEWGSGRSKVGKSIAFAAGFVAQSFENVVGSALTEISEKFAETFESVVSTGKKVLFAPFKAGFELWTSTGVRATELMIAGIERLQEGARRAYAVIFDREFSFGELFTLGADGLKKMSLGFLSLSKSALAAAKTLGGNTFAGAWKAITVGARSGAQNLGVFFQKILGIEKIARFFKGAGGVVGILLGPFGKLLDLFSPFVDMIVEQITPAMETFSAIIKTALGPFSMTLEIIARNLATAIVPLIKPLASFLELAAVQVGVLIQNMLKGKPEKMMAGMFGILNKARPVLMQVLKTLLDSGKLIGATLLDSMMKLLPLVVELGVGLLEAFVPLIPPLTKLSIALLENVFIPALLAIVKILNDHVVPFIKDWMPALGIVIDDVATQVAEFWGNLGKYAEQFKILFIDPIMKWIDDTVAYFGKLIDVFAMEGVFAGLQRTIGDFFGFATDGIQKLLELVGLAEEKGEGEGASMQKAESARRISDEDIKRLELESGGDRDIFAKKMRELRKQRGLAKGGVTTGPTTRLIGEQGPEMVLPLKREVIERTLAPILPEMKFPALDRLVEIAAGIERVLMGGALRVRTDQQAAPARDERNDLHMAPGMMGGGW